VCGQMRGVASGTEAPERKLQNGNSRTETPEQTRAPVLLLLLHHHLHRPRTETPEQTRVPGLHPGSGLDERVQDIAFHREMRRGIEVVIQVKHNEQRGIRWLCAESQERATGLGGPVTDVEFGASGVCSRVHERGVHGSTVIDVEFGALQMCSRGLGRVPSPLDSKDPCWEDASSAPDEVQT